MRVCVGAGAESSSTDDDDERDNHYYMDRVTRRVGNPVLPHAFPGGERKIPYIQCLRKHESSLVPGFDFQKL